MNVSEQLNSIGINIDRTTLQQVSQNILKRAEQKNSQYQAANNIQRFSPQNIGVDLYSGKIDTNLAKQIALNNSGLQITLSQETLSKINYLNSMAALHSGKGVEAKFSIAITDLAVEKQVAPVEKSSAIISSGTAKDKNGSNPFYNGELLMNESKKGEQIEDPNAIVKSIFA